MDYKPSVFIASSSESLVVARAIQRELDSVAEVSVWDQAQFRPTRFPLESLLEILGRSDLGVFIFAPDERVAVGEGQRPVVRDNVLIELGLFIGRLGRDRVAIVVRDDIQPKIPSDLHGLTLLKYRFDRADRNLTASLAPAADMIRMMLSDLPPGGARKASEFDMPIMTLRYQLSKNQRLLLGIFERRTACSIKELLGLCQKWSQSELHYRLEQLRLFSFLHIANPVEARTDRSGAVYTLQHHYLAELKKHPPPLEQDTLSLGDEQAGDAHLPPSTDAVPLDAAKARRSKRT